MFFQLEQAWWQYEDFHREDDRSLPKFDLRSFCARFFALVPSLHAFASQFDAHFTSFRDYIAQVRGGDVNSVLSFFLFCLILSLTAIQIFMVFLSFRSLTRIQSCYRLPAAHTSKLQVPVCGGILLNASMTRCVLVQGYKQRSWSFPRGKINRNESELECAVREVDEEVGFDMRALVHRPRFAAHLATNAHLAPKSEQDPIVATLPGGKRIVLYCAVGVPENFNFQTRTRKEIDKIAWHAIADLPSPSNAHAVESAERNTFWGVFPIVPALLRWVARRGGPPVKGDGGSSSGGGKRAKSAEHRSSSGGRSGGGGGGGGCAPRGPGIGARDDPTFNALTFGGALSGWSAEQMFAAAAAQGVRSTYTHDDPSGAPVSNGRYRQYEPFSFDADAALQQLQQQQPQQHHHQPQPQPHKQHHQPPPHHSATKGAHGAPHMDRSRSAGAGAGTRHGRPQSVLGHEKFDVRNEATFGAAAAQQASTAATSVWTPEQMFAENAARFGVQSTAGQGELRKSLYFAFEGERRGAAPATTPPLASQNAASHHLLSILQRPTSTSSSSYSASASSSTHAAAIANAPPATAPPLEQVMRALSLGVGAHPVNTVPSSSSTPLSSPTKTKTTTPVTVAATGFASEEFSFDCDDIVDSLSFS